MTSIGLWKMSRVQKRKRIESWYLEGKSNQALYKRDSMKVGLCTGFPACKKRSLQIIRNEIISVSPHFRSKKSKVIEYIYFVPDDKFSSVEDDNDTFLGILFNYLPSEFRYRSENTLWYPFKSLPTTPHDLKKKVIILLNDTSTKTQTTKSRVSSTLKIAI